MKLNNNIRKNISKNIALSLVCLSLMPVALAQDSESQDNESNEPTLTIFGSKDLTNSGITSLVSSETIYMQDLNIAPTKISDIIVEVPGIAINGQGGLWQTFSMRGMSRWRIQTTLDGVPIITDRRAGSAVSFVEPGLLGQVDLVKGAVSTLFGSGAIGGVVNLKPTYFHMPLFSLDYSSFGNETGMMFGGQINDMSLGFGYRKADDDFSSVNEPSNSGFEQMSAVIKSSTHFADELTLNWMLVPSKGNNIGKSNTEYPTDKITHYPFEKHLVSKVSLVKQDSWAVEVFSHVQDWQSEVVRVGKRKNIVDYYSLDWGGNSQLNWRHSGVVGRIGLDLFKRSNVTIDEVQYSLNDVGLDTEYYGDADFTKSNLDASETQVSIYSDAQFSFEKIDLHTGLRLSYYSQDATNQVAAEQSTSDNKLTGFVGSSFHLTESFDLNLQLGTGFRFPSLTEKYFNGTTGRGEIVGNNALKPELAFNKEITVSHQLDAVKWSVTYFDVHITDYIERREIAEEVLQYQNLTSGDITGFEALLSYQINQNNKLSFNYQHQKGRSDSGERLADISPNEYNLRYSYYESDWQFKASLKKRMNKNDFASGELALDSVELLDLSFQKSLSDHRTIRLMVDNLFDKNYIETSDELSPYSNGLVVSVKFDQYF